MKKILFCASTASHLINFHLPYMKVLTEMGYEVHALVDAQTNIPHANKILAIPFTKKLYAWNNIKSIVMSWRMLEGECYDLIVTNTTLAAAVVRCSLFFCKSRPRVIHIAHGYLFTNPVAGTGHIYLAVEWLLKWVTDYLVVMNHEDELLAKRYHLYRQKLFYVDGLGFPLENFLSVSAEKKRRLRQQKGFSGEDIVLVYVAEFSKRKNQSLLIEAFAKLNRPQTKLVLIGNGSLIDSCKEQAKKLQIADDIIFPGYISNIAEWYQLSDVAVSTSCIEGLPFNIMEAMACALPIVASNIKGHRELVEDGSNGLLFEKNDVESCCEAIDDITTNISSWAEVSKLNRDKVKAYALEVVIKTWVSIYESIL